MSSFRVLAIFCAFVVLVYCKEEDDTMASTFFECAKENKLDLQKLREIKTDTKDIDKLPKELFCASKCAWEKDGYLKDSKPVMEKVKKNDLLLSMMKDKEAFIKCIADVSLVKECEDAKKLYKCTEDNRFHYLEECAEANKIDENKFTEWLEKHHAGEKKDDIDNMPKEVMCLAKCVFEKQDVLNKDGKIDTEKAKVNSWIFYQVKNQEAFSKCLKELTISQCEDMKKIHDCRKANV